VRVLVATTAGAGHLAALVTFGLACRTAGHEVRVAAGASFADAVGQVGLAHAPFADAAPDALRAVFGQLPRLTVREANDVVLRDVFGRLDAQAALPGLRATVEAWRPDVVVREPAELASYVVAEEFGLPHVQVNIGLDRSLDEMVGLLEEPLHELGCAGGTARLRAAPRWTLLPPSFDVPAAGTAPAPRRFRETPGLNRDAAAPPDWWRNSTNQLVYVTFGSVAAGLGLFPDFYAAVIEALADVPARVLITLGQAGAPETLGTLPDNVHVERWWPQRDLMPHVAAVVGHGGFGTTLLALAAGVPQVVVPLFSLDQFDNAARVAEVRAGVAVQRPDAVDRVFGSVLPAGPAVLERLTDVVLRVLHDGAMRQKARDLAAEIAALPPAADCVPALEDLVSVAGREAQAESTQS